MAPTLSIGFQAVGCFSFLCAGDIGIQIVKQIPVGIFKQGEPAPQPFPTKLNLTFKPMRP